MSDQLYRFEEPHLTGGNATITITREQIIKYIRNHPNLYHGQGLYSEAELVEQFCANNWAYKVKDNAQAVDQQEMKAQRKLVKKFGGK